MKIAIVVPGFSADETDWCIPAHTELVRALATEHEVQVFTMRYPHRVDTYRIGSATIHSFNGGEARGRASANLWYRVMREIAREHQSAPFDVIHAILGSEAGCVAVFAAKRLHVPCVVWLVDGELVGIREIRYGADLNPRLRWMNALILRLADRILCGCDTLTEAAHTRLSHNRRTLVETLPLGVNDVRFSPARPARHAALHFVNVGSLVAVKDQVTLLKAFARVLGQLPGARMTLVGSGPLEADLRCAADELQVNARVHFAGLIGYEQLPALYHRADVFVQASRHEGQGMALLEAAACGCAVCGTDVGALRDLGARHAALTCAVGDAVALAQVMHQTYAGRDRWAVLAHERVARDYALDVITTRLTSLYSSVRAVPKTHVAKQAPT
jgi:glycosyltransferase involved in cell wall biosynthesis